MNSRIQGENHQIELYCKISVVGKIKNTIEDAACHQQIYQFEVERRVTVGFYNDKDSQNRQKGSQDKQP